MIAEDPVHIVAVAALVVRDDGRVLLMKHPRRGWEFPGGQVMPGEDLIAALQREVLEETGIEIADEKLVAICSNVKAEGEIPTKVMLDFVAREVGGSLATSVESSETGWFERSAAIDMVTEQFLKDRITTMLEYDGRIRYRAYYKQPYTVRLERQL